MTGHVPDEIERLVRDEERREAALNRATAPVGGEPGPAAPATGTAAFIARMAAEREREEQHEARVSRLMHEHPDPPLDEPDPLRTLYAEQRASRRRRRRWVRL